MKKFKFLLPLLLISLTAIGAGVVQKYYTDQLQIGISTSGDDKEIIVDTGDGASNPKIKVDGTSKKFSLNTDLTIGTGLGADQKLIYDNGSGANNPFMGYDQASGKLVFSNDGSLVKKFGTGSGGGGGGINAFGDSDNANAEDGLIAWTSVGGTFVNETTAQNVIEGDQSFKFTPGSVNDKVLSSTLNMNLKKYYGITCEAGIEYYGGDENLELHVVDGNGDILNEDTPNNRKIPKREYSRGPFSVSFICPREADIIGDANKGNIHLEIKNVGVGIAPAITWDLTYLGDDRNIGTSVLPDRCNFVADMSLQNIDSSSCSGIYLTEYSVGAFKVNYESLGLTQKPGFQATKIDGGSSGIIVDTGTVTTTSAYIYVSSRIDSGGGLNRTVSIDIIKQGADANKVVKTYKAIPVTSETENTFTIKVNSSGSILTEDVSIASVVRDSIGEYTVTFSEDFVIAPTVQISITKSIVETGASGLSAYTMVHSLSGTGFKYKTGYENAGSGDSGTLIDRDVSLTITRQGSNYKKPQTKNLSLAGIAVNSYAEQAQKQVRTETCNVLNSGTPMSNSVLCDSWVDSFSLTAIGQVRMFLKTGTFSSQPSCTLTAHFGTGSSGQEVNPNMGIIDTAISNSSGAYQNEEFSVTCIGVK